MHSSYQFIKSLIDTPRADDKWDIQNKYWWCAFRNRLGKHSKLLVQNSSLTVVWLIEITNRIETDYESFKEDLKGEKDQDPHYFTTETKKIYVFIYLCLFNILFKTLLYMNLGQLSVKSYKEYKL